MTNKEYRAITQKRKITQIGVLVSDIYKAMDNWMYEHEVGPWELYRHSKEKLQNVVYKEGLCSDSFEFYTAGAMMGDIQLEIMQPIQGIPFYSDCLRQKGDGLHHFKEVVPDDVFEDVLEYYKEQGMEILFGGEFFGSKFYFVDSLPRLGMLLEIGNGRAPEGAPDDWVTLYPCEKKAKAISTFC